MFFKNLSNKEIFTFNIFARLSLCLIIIIYIHLFIYSFIHFCGMEGKTCSVIILRLKEVTIQEDLQQASKENLEM